MTDTRKAFISDNDMLTDIVISSGASMGKTKLMDAVKGKWTPPIITGSVLKDIEAMRQQHIRQGGI